jgi:flavin reductase (DIM6/NTAB) family NADH-FMN oxidoreductase RutF
MGALARTVSDHVDGDSRTCDARGALDQVPRAVSVLTTNAAGALHGTTVDSLTSVSDDPPLVLVSLRAGSRMLATLELVGAFGVSVLASDQEHLARRFASRRRGDGGAQFAGVGYSLGARAGAPLLTGGVARLECRLESLTPGGDHVLVLGRVEAAEAGGPGTVPLLRLRRTFSCPGPTE